MFVILLSIQLYIVEYVDDIQRTKTTTRQTLSRPGSALLLCPYIRSTPIHVALACAHVLSLSHAWLSLSLSLAISCTLPCARPARLYFSAARLSLFLGRYSFVSPRLFSRPTAPPLASPPLVSCRLSPRAPPPSCIFEYQFNQHGLEFEFQYSKNKSKLFFINHYTLVAKIRLR